MPSVPMEQWISNLYSCSLKISLSTKETPMFPHTYTSDSGDRAAWYRSILLKPEIKEKKRWMPLRFLILVSQLSSTITSPMFSLDLLLLLTYFLKLFLIFSLKFNWVLVFHVCTHELWFCSSLQLLTLLSEIIKFPIYFKIHKEFPVQPSWSLLCLLNLQRGGIACTVELPDTNKK